MEAQLNKQIQKFIANFLLSQQPDKVCQLEQFLVGILAGINHSQSIVAKLFVKKLAKENYFESISLLLTAILALQRKVEYRITVLEEFEYIKIVKLPSENGAEWYLPFLQSVAGYIKKMSQSQKIYALLASQKLPDDVELLSTMFRIVNQISVLFPASERAKTIYWIYHRERQNYPQLKLLFSILINHISSVQEYFKILSLRFVSRYKKLPKAQIQCFYNSIDDFQRFQDRLAHFTSISSKASKFENKEIGLSIDNIQQLKLFLNESKSNKSSESPVEKLRGLLKSKQIATISKRPKLMSQSTNSSLYTFQKRNNVLHQVN